MYYKEFRKCSLVIETVISGGCVNAFELVGLLFNFLNFPFTLKAHSVLELDSSDQNLKDPAQGYTCIQYVQPEALWR